MVNIVLLHGQRYLVDVGFGANGPHHPIPLVDDSLNQDYPYQGPNVGPSQIRLMNEPIPDALNQTQKHWIVQHRYVVIPPHLGIHRFSPFITRQAFIDRHVGTTKMPNGSRRTRHQRWSFCRMTLR